MPSDDRPSMASVALRAGVSQMTVSRAFRSDPSIPAVTRERIRRVAAEIGYQPNPMVSALMAQLRTGRRPTHRPSLCFGTAHTTASRWKEQPLTLSAYRGALRRCEELGYALQPFWLTEPDLSPSRITRVLHTRSIVGLIVAPLPEPAPPLNLEWKHFACTAIGFSLKLPVLHRTANDQYATIKLACSVLRERGCRRIGLALRTEDDDRVDNKWFAGYTAFLRYHPDIAPLKPLITDAWTRETFEAWIRAERPDAVITLHPAAEEWLPNQEARQPVIAYLDRESVGQHVAGIDQNAGLVGAAAVDLVVEQINTNARGVPLVPKVVLIEGMWQDAKALAPA